MFLYDKWKELRTTNILILGPQQRSAVLSNVNAVTHHSGCFGEGIKYTEIY
jgi:hypothetical protein